MTAVRESASTPAAAPLLATLARYDCVVLRGLPGSGKSTLARQLAATAGHLHLEADQHFHVDGQYRFDPARVADAHALVARDTLAALLARQPVVVANTHARLWEMAAVIGAAQLAGAALAFVHCRGRWDNQHAVPAEVIAAMAARWEDLPADFGAPGFVWPD